MGDDVYKLTMLSQRKKQEIIDSIGFLPGHRAKLIEVFKKIETVSSKDLSLISLDVSSSKCDQDVRECGKDA
jgi:hypothetical protein